jgi:hypothetical protein
MRLWSAIGLVGLCVAVTVYITYPTLAAVAQQYINARKLRICIANPIPAGTVVYTDDPNVVKSINSSRAYSESIAGIGTIYRDEYWRSFDNSVGEGTLAGADAFVGTLLDDKSQSQFVLVSVMPSLDVGARKKKVLNFYVAIRTPTVAGVTNPGYADAGDHLNLIVDPEDKVTLTLGQNSADGRSCQWKLVVNDKEYKLAGAIRRGCFYATLDGNPANSPGFPPINAFIDISELNKPDRK